MSYEAAVAASAAAVVAQAIKASGAIVRVEPQDFMAIISRVEKPLVVMAESKFIKFTPLESPAACSGDEPRKTFGLLRGEDIIPFRANTGFNAPCEPPRWKVEDFLTGFTYRYLTAYKGLVFSTKTNSPLQLPGTAELVIAKQI